jgi:hypothetical protein
MDEMNFDEHDSQMGDDYSSLAPKLAEAAKAADLSASLTVPLIRLIDDLLVLAADSLGSDVGSVLVRDGDTGGLKFLTALGAAKEALLKLRVPAGKGIAGSVFSSGQPIAVSDANNEGSFWSEADARTGFLTKTVLATPLRSGGEIIGVLEFVNRRGEPPYAPFTPEEMDRAAYFAESIAKIVDAHAIAQLVEGVFDRLLESAFVPGLEPSEQKTKAMEWLQTVHAPAKHREVLMLALSLYEIAGKGGAELAFCREVLDALVRFSESRSATNMGFSLNYSF